MRYLHTLAALAIIFATALAAHAGDSKGTIAGKVVDERGKAISGARVLVSGAAEAEATTDAKGNFEVALEPGDYRLTVEADGYASASLREIVTVHAGKRTKLGDRVELPKSDSTSVVRGSVFDELGRSIPGAKVVLERVPADDNAPVAKYERETRTDSTGLFAFRVPEGEARYRLTATMERRTASTVTVDVFGGEIVNAPPLKLAPSGKE
jgi:hypothetical protein